MKVRNFTTIFLYRHNQNYRDRFLDKLEDGFKHAKDASERANQLSQYRRYKPLEQEILEEARMYPERVEDEVRFDDDDDVSILISLTKVKRKQFINVCKAIIFFFHVIIKGSTSSQHQILN